MAYVDQNRGSRQLPSVAGVVVHALIGYAFISGLAMNVVHTVLPVFTVDSIPDTSPPPPIPPSLPMPRAHQLPERVTTVKTPFDNLRPTTPVIVPSDIPHVDIAPIDTIAGPPEVRPASKATGPRVKGARAGWITTEDYPSASIRAGEAGTVGIAVAIGADGRVDSCTVTASSGHSALDAATCRLYERRARFTPARDDAGNPVAARYTDRIRWELPAQ